MPYHSRGIVRAFWGFRRLLQTKTQKLVKIRATPSISWCAGRGIVTIVPCVHEMKSEVGLFFSVFQSDSRARGTMVTPEKAAISWPGGDGRRQGQVASGWHLLPGSHVAAHEEPRPGQARPLARH